MHDEFWLRYQSSNDVQRCHYDLDLFTVILGGEETTLEDVLEEWYRLKKEQKEAEELIEEYVEEKISETLTDAPLDDPMHHSWDRYLKLANPEMT